MIFINPIHECDAIYVDYIFRKSLPKVSTREQKRYLTLLIYFVSMWTFLTDINY